MLCLQKEIFQDADLRQIRIQTQILLNLILTLVIKHLSIINKGNLSTPQRLLEVLSSKLLCDAIFPAWPGESNVPCFANGHFSLISLSLAAKVFKIHEILV